MPALEVKTFYPTQEEFANMGNLIKKVETDGQIRDNA